MNFFQDLSEEFGCKTEDELYQKLSEDFDKLNCVMCRKEIPYEKSRSIDGDPYCIQCYEIINNVELEEDV